MVRTLSLVTRVRASSHVVPDICARIRLYLKLPQPKKGFLKQCNVGMFSAQLPLKADIACNLTLPASMQIRNRGWKPLYRMLVPESHQLVGLEENFTPIALKRQFYSMAIHQGCSVEHLC
eukprot:1138787-Pelagomonas_calceolata.AAC.1